MLTDLASICLNSPKDTSTCLNGPDVPHPCDIRALISHSDPLISAGLEAVLQKRRDLRVVFPRFESEFVRDIDGESAEADVVIADYESGLRLSETTRESRSRVVILTHSDSEAQMTRCPFCRLSCGLSKLAKPTQRRVSTQRARAATARHPINKNLRRSQHQFAGVY